MVPGNNAHQIHLEKEKETLLITLYAKALDTHSKHPILNDTKANEIIGLIDYNFDKINSFGNDLIVLRAKQLDIWLKEFLNSNTNANVLNLGCGLDTRITRINPQSTVSWFDVDFPEVINVRKLFYSDRDNYTMIESSVTELNWLVDIPNNKPTMIIAEGILEYLTEDEVKTLLNGLTNHFNHGQIAFDVMNSFAINSGKDNLKEATGAEHKWAVDDLNKVDHLNSNLVKLDSATIMGSKYIHQLSLKYRLIYGLMYLIPNFRNMIRLLLYRF